MITNNYEKQLSPFEVLVVNYHCPIRMGLKAIIDKLPEINNSDMAENGMIAIEMMKKRHYNLVLLGLEMPIMDGTTTFFNIRKYFPSSKVIICSINNEKRQVIELVNSGVDGYLLIDALENEFQIAISETIKGNRYFTEKVKAIIDDHFILNESDQKSQLNVLLSHREIEIVRCICLQLTAKQIADKLFISEHTVNNHRSNIMKKLGVRNSTGIAVEAKLLGIIKNTI